jgi:hypothetical protein
MSDPAPPEDLDLRAYWDGVDGSLLRMNLKLTVQQRIEQLMAWQRAVEELQRGGRPAPKRRETA